MLNCEILGTIVKDFDGYNIVDMTGKRMLVKSYSSLKRLLSDLANNIVE